MNQTSDMNSVSGSVGMASRQLEQPSAADAAFETVAILARVKEALGICLYQATGAPADVGPPTNGPECLRHAVEHARTLATDVERLAKSLQRETQQTTSAPASLRSYASGLGS